MYKTHPDLRCTFYFKIMMWQWREEAAKQMPYLGFHTMSGSTLCLIKAEQRAPTITLGLIDPLTISYHISAQRSGS